MNRSFHAIEEGNAIAVGRERPNVITLRIYIRSDELAATPALRIDGCEDELFKIGALLRDCTQLCGRIRARRRSIEVRCQDSLRISAGARDDLIQPEEPPAGLYRIRTHSIWVGSGQAYPSSQIFRRKGCYERFGASLSSDCL
jgi:hypothetical protein